MNLSHVTKIVNVELREFSSTRTIDFILKQLHPDFKDTTDNKEDIYRIEDLKDEYAGENKPDFQFKNDIKELINLCSVNDCGYFKIINR